MIRTAALTLCSLVGLVLAMSAPASAQGGGLAASNPGRGAGPTVQHAAPSLPTSARAAWPRLDPGAVVCRTRDDLQRHADIVRARADGTIYGGALPDCRVLGSPVAIDIVSRESSAATQVKLKDATAATGWTDTWLPSTPPR